MVQRHLQGLFILLETTCLDISGSSREATSQPPACLHIWNSGDRLCHSVSASLWVQCRLEAIFTKQLELKDSEKKKIPGMAILSGFEKLSCPKVLRKSPGALCRRWLTIKKKQPGPFWRPIERAVKIHTPLTSSDAHKTDRWAVSQSWDLPKVTRPWNPSLWCKSHPRNTSIFFLSSLAHVAFFPLLVMNHNSEKPTEVCLNSYLKSHLLKNSSSWLM